MNPMKFFLAMSVVAVGAMGLTGCSNDSSTGTGGAEEVQMMNGDNFQTPLTPAEMEEAFAHFKGGEGVQADVTYTASLRPDEAVEADVSNSSRTDVANWTYFSFSGTSGEEVTIKVHDVDAGLDPSIYFASGFATSTTGINYSTSFFRGGELTYLTRADRGGCGQDEEITYTLPSTGTYTVMVFRVSSSCSTTEDGFSLTVSGADACSSDADGDGVDDADDDYPNSITDPSVSIDGLQLRSIQSAAGQWCLHDGPHQRLREQRQHPWTVR